MSMRVLGKTGVGVGRECVAGLSLVRGSCACIASLCVLSSLPLLRGSLCCVSLRISSLPLLRGLCCMHARTRASACMHENAPAAPTWRAPRRRRSRPTCASPAAARAARAPACMVKRAAKLSAFGRASGWEASAARLDLRSAAKTAAVTKLASRKPRRNVRSICRAPVAVDHASGSPTQPRSAPVGGGNGERTSCDVAWARGGPLAGARGLSRAQSALALGLMDGATCIIAGRRRGLSSAQSKSAPLA